MIKDLLFLIKQNLLFYNHNKGNQLLLWVLFMVVILLVGAIFIASQNGLLNKNVDGLVDYTGGLFGSTND